MWIHAHVHVHVRYGVRVYLAIMRACAYVPVPHVCACRSIYPYGVTALIFAIAPHTPPYTAAEIRNQKK